MTRPVTLLALLFLLASLTERAEAFPGGVSRYSGNPATNSGRDCSQCHGGGVQPTVTLTGPSPVSPGSVNTYSLTISGGQRAFGALDVSASAGALAAFETGTKLLDGAITQTTRKAVDAGGSVSFSFRWTAPATAGPVTLYGAGLSADGNGGTGGDGTRTATLAIQVESAPPTNESPVADPGGPYTGTAGQAVHFDGTNSADPDGTLAAYSWNFGDGATGTGSTPSHTYANAGTYQVRLTVTDNRGATGQDTTSATISPAPVVNLPPVADAGGPYTGTAGQAVHFDGTNSADPDGTLAAYSWNFGDGSTGVGAQPVHAYTTAGLFTVELTVTDDDGLTDADQASASVAEVSGGDSPSAKVWIVSPRKLKIKEGQSKTVHLVVRVKIDEASLQPGVETCGTVLLLKDAQEVGEETICVTARPRHDDEEDEEDDDEDEEGDDDHDDVSGPPSSGVFRHRKIHFHVELSAADAPEIQWSAVLEMDGGPRATGLGLTQMMIRQGRRSGHRS